jgi:hypothetical protein
MGCMHVGHDIAYVSRTRRKSKRQDVIDNSNIIMSESLRVFDLDLVLYPNRRMRLYAACWLGGEEAHGCKAFTAPDLKCDVMTTSVCLLWKDVGAISLCKA